MRLSRRDLLAKCMAAGVLTPGFKLSAEEATEAWTENERALRQPTPPVELGPFYKKRAPSAKALRAPGDRGMPLVVSGQVFNTRGDALPGAVVEVWQTDHLGQYDLDGYRYRAALPADAQGKYEFDSVMPGHYPARVCQHVHYLVRAPGHKPLVTQLYFGTDPVFEGDPDKNYVRDPLITSRELVRPVTLIGDPADIRAAVRFELVLETL